MSAGKNVYVGKRIYSFRKPCGRVKVSWDELRTFPALPWRTDGSSIRVAIDEALKCKETGEEKTIVFGLTGTGYFDMVAYQKYNDGEMSDYIPTDADLQVGFAGLPKVE